MPGCRFSQRLYLLIKKTQKFWLTTEKLRNFWFATGKNSELCWHKLERNNWKTKNLYCAHDTWHIRFEHWVYEHGHDIEIQTRKNTNTEKYKHKIKNTNTDVLNCKIFRIKLWKYLSGIAKLQKVLQKVLQNCKKYLSGISKLMIMVMILKYKPTIGWY